MTGPRAGTRVRGKVAVVSGGGSGIGRAAAHLLAAEGARVIVADLDRAGAERCAAEISAGGGNARAVMVDISDEADVGSLAASVREHEGSLQILVNSAAVTDPAHQRRDGTIVDMATEVWDRTLAVDLTGTAWVCRALVPLMLNEAALDAAAPAAPSSIVNITSNSALAGDSTLTAYAVAKAGLDQLTRSIATAFGRRGLRCNSVSPAHIASPSFAANVPPEVAAMLEANCLLPRLGRVDDVARAVLFLASDESSFITGQTLRVDGGALSHLPTYAQRLGAIGTRPV